MWKGLVEDIPQSLSPSIMWGHSKKPAVCSPEAVLLHPTCWHLDLGLVDLQNCDKLISVVYKPPSQWEVVIAARMDWGVPCALTPGYMTQGEGSAGNVYGAHMASLKTWHLHGCEETSCGERCKESTGSRRGKNTGKPLRRRDTRVVHRALLRNKIFKDKAFKNTCVIAFVVIGLQVVR